jgi:ribose transport system substrate-binding protein
MSRAATGRMIPAIAAVALLTLTAACSSAQSSTTASGGSSGSSGPAKWNIAVLVGGGSNAYQAAGVAAIEAAAASDHATVKVFDASFDANTQYSQFQTVITSGKYQGVLIDPVNGAGIVPLVQQAANAKIKVAAWNQPIGSNYSTPDPSVPGVTAQAMFPVRNHGLVMGNLTKQACALAKAQPCNVAVLYFEKGSTYDTAVLAGFESVVGTDPNIRIVAGADTQATRQGGLSAAQTILTGHPNVNVMFGTSQSVEGAAQAVAAAHLSHKVYLIGEALTRQGAQMVADGTLFGGSQSMAGQEGSLALQQLTDALEGKSFQSGIDPDTYLHSACADGVTKANVGQCSFDFNG